MIRPFDGNGLRPYAPVHLQFSGGVGADISVSWVRRTRIDGDSWDAPEVPLGEESEVYLVRVMMGGAVLREVMVSTPSWDYLAANQTADALALPARIEVAQISARFGPGLFASVDLEP